MAKSIVVSAVGTAPGSATVKAVGKLRSNLSMAHLKSALHAATEAHRVEQENKEAEHGPWFDQMMVHVPVAVVMSAASIEAAVNEWTKDRIDAQYRRAKKCSEAELLQDLLDDRAGTALTRFRKLCLYVGIVPDQGTSAYENAKWLNEFRNQFMHFKPAWSDEKVHDGELVQALKKKVAVYAPYRRQFLHPYGFMTYGCAKWAVESAIGFITHYSKAHDFADRLGPKDRLKLP